MTKQELLEKIESLKTEQGGWTKEALQSLGVSWPPVKGWKDDLLGKCDD